MKVLIIKIFRMKVLKKINSSKLKKCSKLNLRKHKCRMSDFL